MEKWNSYGNTEVLGSEHDSLNRNADVFAPYVIDLAQANAQPDDETMVAQNWNGSGNSGSNPRFVCAEEPGRIAIPTQLPFGATNQLDCTKYSRESRTVRSYETVKDSVVKVSGTRQYDRVTFNPSASGFVLTGDGKLVTDLHILRDLQNITVTLNDGKKYRAHLVAADRRMDLAILKIDGAGGKVFRTLPMGSSKTLQNGDSVTAYGYPDGADRLFISPGTAPIGGFRERTNLQEVLANGKSLSQEELNKLLLEGEKADREVLDSNLLVTLGNSGGPLVDGFNQAVGVIVLSDRKNQAYATPIEPVVALLEFAQSQEGKPNAKIFFDEVDVSPNAERETLEARTAERAQEKEVSVNRNSVKGKPEPFYPPHGPSLKPVWPKLTTFPR